ncbi:MAG: DedA family protein [Acidobacteriaceae bacterium]
MRAGFLCDLVGWTDFNLHDWRSLMTWLYHTIRHALVHWGYLAVIGCLLAENAGLPLPGETTLMFASFLAHKTSQLQIGWVIAAGIVAAVIGDNLGFLVGRRMGPRLLRWMKRKFHMEDDIVTAQQQIRRHGPATVFWARYIFGLRTIVGPVAGALEMEWKEFLLYNVLGAVTWVTAICVSGYLFAKEFQTLLGFFEKASWAIGVGVFAIGYILWRREKKHVREAREKEQSRESTQT